MFYANLIERNETHIIRFLGWGFGGDCCTRPPQSEEAAHPVFGFAADKLMRPKNGKSATVDRGGRDSWERTIHLDGRPVDRYTFASSKLARPHRLLKGEKGSTSPLVEEAVGKDRDGSCIRKNRNI